MRNSPHILTSGAFIKCCNNSVKTSQSSRQIIDGIGGLNKIHVLHRNNFRPSRPPAAAHSPSRLPAVAGRVGWSFFGTWEGIGLQHQLFAVTMVFELPSKDGMGGSYQPSIAGKGNDLWQNITRQRA